MTSVRINAAANLAGNLWTAGLGFVVVPVYLHFVGTEGYGLIGLYSVLTAVAVLIDAGFGAAAARELSRGAHSPEHIWSLVITVERVLWVLSIAVIALAILAAPHIARHWLGSSQLSLDSGTNALILLGTSVGVQLPLSFYGSCLMALQRQVRQNIIGAAFATAKAVAATMALWLLAPTVEAFFWAHLLVIIGQVVVTRSVLAKLIVLAPGQRNAKFDLRLLAPLRSFAFGVVGIYAMNVALTQADKLILPSALTLDEFGKYMIAWALAMILIRVAGPLYNAIYPRMTQLVGGGRQSDVVELFHKSAQLMALLVVPAGALLTFFGDEVIFVWTRNVAVAQNTHWVIAALAFGSMTTGIMSVPGSLLLAHGKLRSPLRASAALVVVQLPVTYFAAVQGGMLGAACSALFFVLAYNLSVWIEARHLISRPALNTWMIREIATPLLASAVVLSAANLLFGHHALGDSYMASVAKLGVAYTCCLVTVALVLPFVRREFISRCGIAAPRR